MNLIVAGRPVFAATGGRDFDPALPAAVLVHGAGMDHTVWSLQARFLAHRGRAVLAVDLPGHGRSAGAPLDTVAAMADWLGELVAAASLGRAALVGHSMGALASLAAAARHPEAVERVALLGAALRMPVHPDLLAAAKADDPVAIALIADWGHGTRGQTGAHAVPGLWLRGGTVRLLQQSAPGVLHADLKACADYAGGAADAAGVRAPALVVIGAQDRMTPPREGRALAAAIAGAEAIEIAGAGHVMMVEAPDATRTALARFLLGGGAAQAA